MQTGPSSCTDSIYSVQGAPGTSITTVQLEKGEYSICIDALDTAGNITKASNNGIRFAIKRKFHKIYVTLNQYSVSKMLPYTNDKFPAIKTNADFNCNADAIDVLISLAEAESGYFKAVASYPDRDLRDFINLEGEVRDLQGNIVATPDIFFGAWNKPIEFDQLGAVNSNPGYSTQFWSFTNSNGTFSTDQACNGFFSSALSGAEGGNAETGLSVSASEIDCSSRARLACISRAIIE